MAAIQKFVDSLVAGGGDGSIGNPYASGSEWESNEQTNLVSDDDTHTVFCAGGIDSISFSISGFNTDLTHFVLYTTVPSSNPLGVFDTNKYFLDKGTGLGTIISVQDDNVDFKAVQFRRDGPTGVSSARPCIGITAQAGGNSHDISDCVFSSIAAIASARKSAINSNDSDTVVTGSNNVCFNFDDQNDVAFDIQSASSAKLINNTFQNCTTGIVGLSSTKILNSVFQDCGTDVSGTVDTGNSGNNLSDKASGLPGSNNVHSSVLTFVNKTNDDFHLDSSDSVAIGAGIGPSVDSDVNVLDVDGDTRSGATCDIGFDEVIQSGVDGSVNVTLSDATSLSFGEVEIPPNVIAVPVQRGFATGLNVQSTPNFQPSADELLLLFVTTNTSDGNSTPDSITGQDQGSAWVALSTPRQSADNNYTSQLFGAHTATIDPPNESVTVDFAGGALVRGAFTVVGMSNTHILESVAGSISQLGSFNAQAKTIPIGLNPVFRATVSFFQTETGLITVENTELQNSAWNGSDRHMASAYTHPVGDSSPSATHSETLNACIGIAVELRNGILAGVIGESADTLQDATSNAVGVSHHIATSNVTLEDTESNATGISVHIGNSNSTLDDVTQNATGGITLLGTLNRTLQPIDSTGVVEVDKTITGEASDLFAGATQNATGILRYIGAASIALIGAIPVAFGNVFNIGASNVNLEPATSNAIGNLSYVGASNSTLNGATSIAAGSITLLATVNVTLEGATGTGEGIGGILAEGGVISTLDDVVSVANGIITPKVIAALDVTLDDITQIATGLTRFAGTSSVTLDDVTGLSSGLLHYVGSSNVTLDNISTVIGNSEGVVHYVASGDMLLADTTFNAIGSITQNVTGTAEAIGTNVQSFGTGRLGGFEGNNLNFSSPFTFGDLNFLGQLND